MDKKYIFTILISSVIILIFSLNSCGLGNNVKDKYFHNEGFIFGTVYNIKYEHTEDLSDTILLELNRVDTTFSMFNPDSDISRINKNEPDVFLNNWFVRLFKKAEEISVQTDGAFDITVAPLVNLWGFGFEKKDSIRQDAIDSLMNYIGYQKVRMENNRIVKEHPETLLDVSAIAKGFSCDIIADLLEAKGIENYLIEIGGEMRTKGQNPKGHHWIVGITEPDEEMEKQTILQKIYLYDKALATSGNYRNFYYKDGQKYAHTIDPKTGYPVLHTLLSASVIADDCMTADAYATAFMVLGLEKTKEVLGKHPELNAYLIYTDEKGENQVFYTENFDIHFVY
ncbi:MAG: FAD:protein FMN transferase [Candidatus Azobacteroides sp.]|nr:FAD:protein FMN transferase [Candidatus Azobacteroides sp.]